MLFIESDLASLTKIIIDQVHSFFFAVAEWVNSYNLFCSENPCILYSSDQHDSNGSRFCRVSVSSALRLNNSDELFPSPCDDSMASSRLARMIPVFVRWQTLICLQAVESSLLFCNRKPILILYYYATDLHLLIC